MNGLEERADFDMVDMSATDHDELDLLMVEAAPPTPPKPVYSALVDEAPEAGPSQPIRRSSRSPAPNDRLTSASPVVIFKQGSPSPPKPSSLGLIPPVTRRPWSSLPPSDPVAAEPSTISHTLLVYDERMLLHHEINNEHPEQPERIGLTYRKLEERGFLKRLQRMTAREVTRKEVLLAHTDDVWQKVQDLYGPSSVLITVARSLRLALKLILLGRVWGKRRRWD